MPIVRDAQTFSYHCKKDLTSTIGIYIGIDEYPSLSTGTQFEKKRYQTSLILIDINLSQCEFCMLLKQVTMHTPLHPFQSLCSTSDHKPSCEMQDYAFVFLLVTIQIVLLRVKID